MGTFEKLEDQMTMFNSWEGKESPDRLDALVHSCRFHIKNEARRGRIIDPRDFEDPNRFRDDGLGFDFGW